MVVFLMRWTHGDLLVLGNGLLILILVDRSLEDTNTGVGDVGENLRARYGDQF